MSLIRTPPPGIDVFERPPSWLSNALDGDQVAEALRALPEVSAVGHLSSCRAVDLRLSRTGWSVWYDVTVAGADAGTRMITLTGSLDPARILNPGIPQRPAAGQLVPFGDKAWSAILPGLGLVVRTAAGDEGLVALELLADPARARPLFERALDQQAYPGIRISVCEPQVVRYARGSRITVVVRLHYGPDADPSWPRVVVAKAYHDDEGAHAFAAMRALWQSDLSLGRVVRIAQPLAYLPEHRVLVQTRLPGEGTLADLLRAAVPHGAGPAMDQLLIALGRTADGLVALHSCGADHGEEQTPTVLLRQIGQDLGRLERTVPSVAGVADQLIDHFERRASEAPSDTPRPAHGAFRPDQVLVNTSGVAFIDFDGFCLAEPANDIGRFRAKLREVGLAAPGGCHPPLSAARQAVVDELADVFLDRYEEHFEEQRDENCTVSRERVALWEDLALTRVLTRSWPRGKLGHIPALLSLLGHQPVTGPAP